MYLQIYQFCKLIHKNAIFSSSHNTQQILLKTLRIQGPIDTSPVTHNKNKQPNHPPNVYETHFRNQSGKYSTQSINRCSGSRVLIPVSSRVSAVKPPSTLHPTSLDTIFFFTIDECNFLAVLLLNRSPGSRLNGLLTVIIGHFTFKSGSTVTYKFCSVCHSQFYNHNFTKDPVLTILISPSYKVARTNNFNIAVLQSIPQPTFNLYITILQSSPYLQFHYRRLSKYTVLSM